MVRTSFLTLSARVPRRSARWTIGQLGAWVAKHEAAARVVFVGGFVASAHFRALLAFPVGFEVRLKLHYIASQYGTLH